MINAGLYKIAKGIVLFIFFNEHITIISKFIEQMENNSNKSIYQKYEQNRIMDKTMPQFDMLKTLETFKKSVDAFNSYGIKKNALSDNPEAVPVEKRVLAERN